jgi:hypothetical protein
VLAGSRAEPVDEARAKPAIEQFLGNDAKRKLVESDIKGLRTAAKIEYVGKFVQAAASAPAGGASATDAPAVQQPVVPAAPAAPASGGLDPSVISKGMGLGKR